MSFMMISFFFRSTLFDQITEFRCDLRLISFVVVSIARYASALGVRPVDLVSQVGPRLRDADTVLFSVLNPATSSASTIISTILTFPLFVI